jgi:hypothetical protein
MYLEDWQEKFAGDDRVASVAMAPTNLGNGSFLKKTVMITMVDGSKTFGCAWDGCEFTADNPTTIGTGHWGKVHEPRDPGAKRPYVRKEAYDDWTLGDMVKALREADAKIARAEKARDKALDQVATVREVTRETIAGLRAELAEVTRERDEVRNAARILFPGAVS